jgi:hypothetical protein
MIQTFFVIFALIDVEQELNHPPNRILRVSPCGICHGREQTKRFREWNVSFNVYARNVSCTKRFMRETLS